MPKTRRVPEPAREAVLAPPAPAVIAEWPSIGYTNFYSLCKSNRKQGNDEFRVSRKWRDSNCNTGPTDAEAHKAGAKWGYKLTIDDLDGYLYETEPVKAEGTLNG